MSYIGQPYGLGKPTTYTFTATGGETTLTTSDDGRTLTYTPGNVEVFLNGVRLVSGVDYTALSGSSVTGLDPLVSGDVVVVVVLASQSVADAVSAASGGEFLGGVTVPTLTASTVGLGDGTAISSLGADSFRLAANATSDGTLTGWERVDELESGLLGTGMSESSGSFTFPSAGIYLVIFAVTIRVESGDNFAGARLFVNGNEHQRLQGFMDDRNDTEQAVTQLSVLDVDTVDTLTTDVFSLGGASQIMGDTSITRTSLTFVRLGDA